MATTQVIQEVAEGPLPRWTGGTTSLHLYPEPVAQRASSSPQVHLGYALEATCTASIMIYRSPVDPSILCGPEKADVHTQSEYSTAPWKLPDTLSSRREQEVVDRYAVTPESAALQLTPEEQSFRWRLQKKGDEEE